MFIGPGWFLLGKIEFRLLGAITGKWEANGTFWLAPMASIHPPSLFPPPAAGLDFSFSRMRSPFTLHVWKTVWMWRIRGSTPVGYSKSTKRLLKKNQQGEEQVISTENANPNRFLEFGLKKTRRHRISGALDLWDILVSPNFPDQMICLLADSNKTHATVGVQQKVNIANPTS